MSIAEIYKPGVERRRGVDLSRTKGTQLPRSNSPPSDNRGNVTPVAPGSPPPEFIPAVFISPQTARGPQRIPLKVNSPAEFSALCALIQAPGRLVFDDHSETLPKAMP